MKTISVESNGATWEGEKHPSAWGSLALLSLQKAQMRGSWEQELYSQAAWVQILALPHPSCAASGERTTSLCPGFHIFKRRL